MIALENADRKLLLRVYLNDHLAALSGELELARRTRGNNRGNAVGDYMSTLISEIRQDRETLLGLMASLEIPASRVKQAAAMAAERVGRLKLNGQLLGYSPLSRHVELEALSLGAVMRLQLWRSLDLVSDTMPLLREVSWERLQKRAESQRQQLEEHRLQAIRDALVGDGS